MHGRIMRNYVKLCKIMRNHAKSCEIKQKNATKKQRFYAALFRASRPGNPSENQTATPVAFPLRDWAPTAAPARSQYANTFPPNAWPVPQTRAPPRKEQQGPTWPLPCLAGPQPRSTATDTKSIAHMPLQAEACMHDGAAGEGSWQGLWRALLARGAGEGCW